MARYFGNIGYATTVETSPGVWTEVISKKRYFGDVFYNRRRLESSGGINDNVLSTAEISVVADPYAYDHFHQIRYIEFMGAEWKVSNVEVRRPRLILTLGGLYNGEQA